MTRLWVVRGGREDEFVPTAVETNTMALGWDEVVEDLSAFKNPDSVFEHLSETYPNSTNKRLEKWTGQLYKFPNDIATGDWVVMPCNKGRDLFIGTVEGEYYFDQNAARFKHRRPVKWKKGPVSHNAFKEDLLKSFNSPGTVFQVKVNNALGRVHTVLEEGFDPDFFAWIPFYKAVADALLGYRNKRNELVEGIHKIAERVPSLSASSLRDKFKDGTTGPLKDICPFTTIGIFTKGQMKFDKRKAIAKELASFLGVSEPVPDSFDGIPVLFATKAWFFGFEEDRQPDDIDALWEVFDQAIGFAKSQNQDSRSAFTEAYDKAIRVKGVAWNLTMGLYWVRPMCFPTLDKKSQDYIEEKLELDIKIPKKYPDANKYLEIREKLESHFKDDKCPVHSFPNLSLAAWFYPVPF